MGNLQGHLLLPTVDDYQMSLLADTSDGDRAWHKVIIRVGGTTIKVGFPPRGCSDSVPLSWAINARMAKVLPKPIRSPNKPPLKIGGALRWTSLVTLLTYL